MHLLTQSSIELQGQLQKQEKKSLIWLLWELQTRIIAQEATYQEKACEENEL